MTTTIYPCDHIGVAGTTKLFVQKHDDGTYEARIGIAIMGTTNMEWDELENANPFDADFHDNYADGKGATEEEAIAALKRDMRETADSLWSI